MSRAKHVIALSELADQDLADILQYTLGTWGETQMDIYAAKLDKGMHLLESQPRLGKPRDDWYPGCRCYQVEHHLILYAVVEQQILVARIFHERVDVLRHL